MINPKSTSDTNINMTPFTNYSGISSDNAASVNKTVNKAFMISHENSQGSSL
jgi:hypothetical protein